MATFELIKKYTVPSGGTATVSLASIPNTYTNLKLVASARCTDSGNNWNGMLLKFNTDSTGSNYPTKFVYGYYAGGSQATSSASANQWCGYLTNGTMTSNTFSSTTVDIPYYATSETKYWSSESTTESNNLNLVPFIFINGQWSDTAVINQITLSCDVGNFAENSTFYLYGIKNS